MALVRLALILLISTCSASSPKKEQQGDGFVVLAYRRLRSLRYRDYFCLFPKVRILSSGKHAVNNIMKRKTQLSIHQPV